MRPQVEYILYHDSSNQWASRWWQGREWGEWEIPHLGGSHTYSSSFTFSPHQHFPNSIFPTTSLETLLPKPKLDDTEATSWSLLPLLLACISARFYCCLKSHLFLNPWDLKRTCDQLTKTSPLLRLVSFNYWKWELLSSSEGHFNKGFISGHQDDGSSSTSSSKCSSVFSEKTII